MTRSARKLNSTTASPSTTGPTGAPAASTMTNGSSHWSDTAASPSPRSVLTAVRASVNVWGASPRTWAFHPRSTMPQSASYRSMVTRMRPPPDAILASTSPGRPASTASSSCTNLTDVPSGTSRPS